MWGINIVEYICMFNNKRDFLPPDFWDSKRPGRRTVSGEGRDRMGVKSQFSSGHQGPHRLELETTAKI